MNLEIIKKHFKKQWRWYALAVLAALFFIGASSFNYITQDGNFIKWLSPDETANYTTAKLYGQESRMTIFEKYNQVVDEIIQPRSFRSDNGFIKPVSFLGIILIYGKIVSLSSYRVLPYLTPLIAAIGIIYYYLLIKKLFGRRNALMSAFLLAVFPAYIYYSARSMFHNILFIVLLIIGLYCAVIMIKKKRSRTKYLNWWHAGLAGIFIGLAAITRTSEMLWLIPMLLVLWLFNFKKIGFYKLLIFLGFFAFIFTPVMYWNKILYGSFLSGGYPEMNQSITNIAQASADLAKTTASGYWGYHRDLLSQIKRSVFYFGFKPLHSIKMFYHYFINMFYWLFFPFALGLFLFLIEWKRWRKKHWAYLTCFFLLSVILILYYGSWGFHDNPDPKQFTIGNSYTRYWLPIYLGAIPLASFFIIKLTRLLNKKFYINSFRIIIMVIIYFSSIQFVLHASEEGLIYTAQRQIQAREEFRKVISLTEQNATIITQYHDKLLFPERKVIVGDIGDKNMISRYATLASYLPVYYYSFSFTENDIAYLNNSRLAEAGIAIKKVEQVTNDFTLYKIEKLNNL